MLSKQGLSSINEIKSFSARRTRTCGGAARHILHSLLPEIGLRWPNLIVCNQFLSFGLLAIDAALLTPVVTVGALELSECLPRLKPYGALFDYVLDEQSGFRPDHFDGGFQFAEIDKPSNTINLTPIVERYDFIMARRGLRKRGMPDLLLKGQYNIAVSLADLESYSSL